MDIPVDFQYTWLLLEQRKWEDNILIFEILPFPYYTDLRIIALGFLFFAFHFLNEDLNAYGHF